MIRYLFLFLIIPGATNCFSQESTIKPIDMNMANVSYPFPVSFITITNQDETLKMAYMDLPPLKSNGKTIMLLHGKNFNGWYWETTARVLCENGFRVIIPDQVGFGKSSKPNRIQYSFQLLAQNTKALLDSLGIKSLVVLGHSMGGMLATRFTLMYPQMTEKLILEDPLGLEDWKLNVPYQSVDDWYKFELKQNYAAIKKYQQENYYGGNWDTAYDKWLNLQAGWTIHPDYPKIAWNSALIYDMIFTQPVLYEFELIKCPTLLIIGQNDRTALGKNLMPEEVRKTMGKYPELGKLTARKIKGAKLAEIENTGHLPHIQSFDRFIKALMPFLLQ
ncbi:MAG: alpha/beta hydrolase [Chitinophagaceae bacterium]